MNTLNMKKLIISCEWVNKKPFSIDYAWRGPGNKHYFCFILTNWQCEHFSVQLYLNLVDRLAVRNNYNSSNKYSM